MKTDTPRPIHLKDYRPSPYLIDTVDLDISLHPTRTTVRSKLTVRRNPKAMDGEGALRLDGEMLQLEELKLNGKRLRPQDYVTGNGFLTLPKVPSRPFTLEAVTHIDPENNKALQGLYLSRGIYCTQCEAQGFRRITYFLDRPDVLATYRTRLEASPEIAPVLLANGNLVESGTTANGKLAYAVWSDPHPKPCYLFAVVGGKLGSVGSTFKTMSGRNVDLKIWVEPGKEDRCAWALDSLERSMRWDEVRFGREYDLDVFNIVAVSDFNMGAMENKGLNIFNDRLILASPETATDANFEAIESVVAHEYFHNWTGNRITCRDWFQLCLKEGLTVYRDQEFSADERSRAVQRITDVRQLRAHQFPEDGGPLAHPVRPKSYIEINNFYTATVYEKGAELVRMIETLIGRETFRRGMDLYFERHDGDAATIEDFIACFEEASGRKLDQFAIWYAQAGTPELVCAFDWDGKTKTATLSVEQVLPPTPGEAKKKPLEIPLRVGLVGPDGKDIPLVLDGGRRVSDGVLRLTKRSETFQFEGVTERPVPSLLRGFSAPVRLSIDLSDKQLEFLMARDCDLFNRWQAAQDFATRTLIQLVQGKVAGKRLARGSSYAKALGQTITDPKLEAAYRAELLKLPSESDVARDIGRNVETDAIHAARRHLMRVVGGDLGDMLEEIYAKAAPKGRFSPDAASAGKRALRNAVLTLLSAREGADDVKRVAQHFKKARNMTDAAHALHLLAYYGGPESEAALAQFHDRWKDDHVVIDTWFAAQALSPLPGTLARVRELTRHPLFSLTTPNKVRAVIGNFAMGNPVQFHRPDGSGYAFVAEQVLALDRFNPQVAARLLASFRSWRAFEPKRQAAARGALADVAKAKGLSRDVFEIVSKMLDG